MAVWAGRCLAPDDDGTSGEVRKVRASESLDLCELACSSSKFISSEVGTASIEELSEDGINSIGDGSEALAYSLSSRGN